MAKIPLCPRLNCYFGCGQGGPLHHFPKPDTDTERFNIWKAVLDNDVKEKGNKYIYNQLRLCNKHFENYFISPSNRLTRNAFPTLYIQDNSSSTSAGICIEPVQEIEKLDKERNSLKLFAPMEQTTLHEIYKKQQIVRTDDIEYLNDEPCTPWVSIEEARTALKTLKIFLEQSSSSEDLSALYVFENAIDREQQNNMHKK